MQCCAVSTDVARVCRICFGGQVDEKQPIVALGCLCRGDLGFAHKKCLRRWLLNRSRNHLQCEICLSNFSNRHSKLLASPLRGHRRSSSYESISPGSISLDATNNIIYAFGYKIYVNVKQPMLAVVLCLVIVLEVLQFASKLHTQVELHFKSI